MTNTEYEPEFSGFKVGALNYSAVSEYFLEKSVIDVCIIWFPQYRFEFLIWALGEQNTGGGGSANKITKTNFSIIQIYIFFGPIVTFSNGYLEELDCLTRKAKLMLSVIYYNLEDLNTYFRQLGLPLTEKGISFGAVLSTGYMHRLSTEGLGSNGAFSEISLVFYVTRTCLG